MKRRIVSLCALVFTLIMTVLWAAMLIYAPGGVENPQAPPWWLVALLLLASGVTLANAWLYTPVLRALSLLAVGIDFLSLAVSPALRHQEMLAVVLGCAGLACIVLAGLWVIRLAVARPRRIPVEWRALLAEDLADMVDCGLPLHEAVPRVKQDVGFFPGGRKTARNAILARVAEDLSRGSPLSEAIAVHPDFPPFWKRLLAEGERCDRLGAALRRVAVLERQTRVVRFGSLGSEGVTLVVLALVGWFLNQYIIPTFVAMLENMNLMGNPLLQFILAVRRGWVPGMVLLFLGWVLWRANPGFRAALQRLPGIWPLVRLEQQAAITATLATAFDMGLPVPQAVRMAAATADHPVYSQRLQAMSHEPSLTVARVVSRHPSLFAPPLAWLAGQGEAFGNLPEALRQAADHFADEAERYRMQMRRSFQLLLTLAVGAFLALLVVGIYGGLYEVAFKLIDQVTFP